MTPSAVQNRAQAEVVLRGLVPALRTLGVARLRLFGSFARDAARADSDVDVLVRFHPDAARYETLLDLHTMLSERLGRTVEVVTEDGLSPYFRAHILEEAHDVFSG